MALFLDIFPRDLSLSYQEDVSDRRRSTPTQASRAARPPSPKAQSLHCPSSPPLALAARSTAIRAIATKFLRPSSPFSLSLSPSFSTLKIYYSCELWRRCCSRKSTALEGKPPPKSHETDRPTDIRCSSTIPRIQAELSSPLPSSSILPLVLSARSDSSFTANLSFPPFSMFAASQRSWSSCRLDKNQSGLGWALLNDSDLESEES